MQKTLLLLLGLIPSFVQAQRKAPVLYFPFEGYERKLSPEQVRLADSLYNNLYEGESLRLELLSAAEQNMEREKISEISYHRAGMILTHYWKTGIPSSDFCAEIVPFQMPHVVRTNDLTRASAISVARKSRTYVVLTKTETKSTSIAAVHFNSDFSTDQQTFEFYPNAGIETYLASGTRIYIPAGSLQQTNGQEPACEKVTLRVSEYLDLEAVALKAMTTTSEGKNLQTGGMWYIDVVCNGQPLVMKPGTQYQINVRINGEPKKMKVFSGREKNGLLDWKEETDSKVILPNDALPEESDGESRYEEGNYRDSAIFDMSNQYGLQLNNFGWINCDAFDQGQELTNLMVYGDIDEKTNVMLVYNKRKSVLPGYLCQDKKSVKFSDIAADETALLVVFKKNG